MPDRPLPDSGPYTGHVPPAAQYRPMRDPDGDTSMRNIALAAVAIAAIVMGGVYVLSRHHQAGIPVIEADTTPLRVKPANPGGMQIAGSDDSVLMNKDGTEADNLAPPPEAPAPQALPREAEQPAPPPAIAAAPPLAPAAPPPLPATLPPAIAPPEQPLPVPRAEAPPPAPRARPAPARSGGAQVQLAALDSEAAANAAWAELARRNAGLLAGHSPAILRVEKDGRTFYRLRTGGFADIAAATEFCSRLRVQGAACTIASF